MVVYVCSVCFVCVREKGRGKEMNRGMTREGDRTGWYS